MAPGHPTTMHLPSSLRLVLLLVPAFLSAAPPSPPEAREIPAPLKPWETWATWDVPHRFCPTPYDTADKPLCFWPSRLGLEVDRTGGTFRLGVTVFSETWVPLPGGPDVWPTD